MIFGESITQSMFRDGFAPTVTKKAFRIPFESLQESLQRIELHNAFKSKIYLNRNTSAVPGAIYQTPKSFISRALANRNSV